MTTGVHETPAPTFGPTGDGLRRTLFRIEFDGLVRRFLVVEPPTVTGGPRPLVLDLHGSGFDIESHLRLTRSVEACRWGAVVVIPEASIPLTFPSRATEGRAWAVPGTLLFGEATVRATLPDDVAFLISVLDTVREARSVDADRIHAMGFSGGARLCSLLPAARPGQIASIAGVAGVRFPAGLQRTDVSVLALHGRADAVNPYGGGDGTRWDEPVPDTARAWAAAAGCPARPTTTASEGIETASWHRDGVERVRLTTFPAGHCWPGSSDPEHIRLFGRCTAPDATPLILDFFRAHPRIPGADTSAT